MLKPTILSVIYLPPAQLIAESKLDAGFADVMEV